MRQLFFHAARARRRTHGFNCPGEEYLSRRYIILFPPNVTVTRNCCVNLTHPSPVFHAAYRSIVFYDRWHRPRIRPIRNYGIALVYHRLARFPREKDPLQVCLTVRANGHCVQSFSNSGPNTSPMVSRV